MRNKLLLLLSCLVAIISHAQPPKNAIVLGLDRQIYTDSLPHSATGVYYVAADITLSGNICVENTKFLFKSNFRRNQIFDLQQNKNIRKTGGTSYGTNIQLCGANLTLRNCTLTAADSGMWGGLYMVDSSSVLQLKGCRFSDSYHGIVQQIENALKVENSTFRNNYVSLQLAGRRDTLRHNNFSSRPSAHPNGLRVTLVITNFWGCKDTLTATVTPQGITGNKPVQKGVFVGEPYPNPASNSVSINYGLPSACKSAVVRLSEVGTGKVLIEQEMSLTDNTLRLNTAPLAAGMYVLQVYADGAPLGVRKVSVIK